MSWRGDSCLKDGNFDSSSITNDLVCGYYDAGDAIKFHFPSSFTLTMLSWSVIEYKAKYEAAGELNHVKEIIKWVLMTFSRPSIILPILLPGSLHRYYSIFFVIC